MKTYVNTPPTPPTAYAESMKAAARAYRRVYAPEAPEVYADHSLMTRKMRFYKYSPLPVPTFLNFQELGSMEPQWPT